MFKKRILIVLLILILIPALSESGVISFGAASVFAADKKGDLEIRIGYLGTDYVTKKVYTAAQLRAIGTIDQLFTYVDSMPTPVLQTTRGVPLVKILYDAGIDPGSVQRYDFKSEDDHKAYQEFTSQSLLDTARYYYPNLTGTWNKDTGSPGFGAEEDAVKVQSVIALDQYMERFGTEQAYDRINSNSGYRLCFGMVSAGDILGAHDSVHHIIRIDCQLVGSPPEGFIEDDPDLVGSKPDNNSNAEGAKKDKDKDKDSTKKDSSGSGKNAAGTGSDNTSAAAVGKSRPGVEVKGSDAKPVGALSSEMVKKILSSETMEGTAMGDVPWNIYEISMDSTPFAPPKADPRAVAAVTSLLALAFLLGALTTYRRYRLAYL